MRSISRRSFIVSTGATLGACRGRSPAIAAVDELALSTSAQVFVDYINRLMPYVSESQAVVRQFALEWDAAGREPRDGAVYERLLTTRFLLSTNFFARRAGEPLEFVRLHSPVLACGNPFAEPATGG